MKQQLEQGLDVARNGISDAVDRIPPEAWPVIDQMFRILTILAVVWLLLAVLAWWRRKAYNLTIASTASRRKAAQPDFLGLDKDAREDAIERGEAHDKVLDKRERDDALATLRAAKEPIGLAARLASIATAAMSIITLVTGFMGSIGNVTKMNEYLEDASATERMSFIVQQHPLGCAIAVFAIGYAIWRYFAEKKWKEA